MIELCTVASFLALVVAIALVAYNLSITPED